MKAAYYEQFGGSVRIENLADPVPCDDGVVIRVEATGLCRSDWHGWMGHDSDISLPHVPGHELAGVIEEAGSQVTDWQPGDRVTLPFVCGCGSCNPCRMGNQQICDRQFQPGFTHWGSFAEFVAIKYAQTNLVRLPSEVDFVTAASLGCRFATAFRAIVDLGKVKEGQWVAIHGCGGVGLSAVMIASALGARVIAVDIGDAALELARNLGAVETVNASVQSDIVDAVQQLSSGGVHVSMDALGHPDTCFNSIAGLRKHGKHLQVGLLSPDERNARIPTDMIIARELEILGSHGMQAHRYPAMLDMITSGKLSPSLLLGETISLSDAPERLINMDQFDQAGVVVIDRFQQ
jgi:alcohol dehydrogenase